ncbi:MAG: SHOCT domain-containing protein [Candidatus Microbacterium phytovorans]|uniref:SHOCT domain-containing protein n=1 Tax=Candidatus Microbacterium phytovorans TaxID=3121374 RepID=A0AAJ5W2U9_9MICO|nr:SHOCT domain-containing protein [Microbacterium sp.]WEK14697.1 MAG: SHOCT domain-containing protein [Microbacterium sp.]
MRAAELIDDIIIEPVDPTMGASAGFAGFFGVVVLLMVIGVIFSAVVGYRKYRILRDAGTDPFTVDAALAAKVLKSDVLAAPAAARSIEERLRELDDLLARGVITADEHREARAAALRD